MTVRSRVDAAVPSAPGTRARGLLVGANYHPTTPDLKPGAAT
jgi:hypothetical protein